jgi:hypothetical protein
LYSSCSAHSSVFKIDSSIVLLSISSAQTYNFIHSGLLHPNFFNVVLLDDVEEVELLKAE